MTDMGFYLDVLLLSSTSDRRVRRAARRYLAAADFHSLVGIRCSCAAYVRNERRVERRRRHLVRLLEAGA